MEGRQNHSIFVSFSQCDKIEALRLIHKLRRCHFPKNLRPVQENATLMLSPDSKRSAEERAGTKLQENAFSAETVQFLIVVCSIKSAKSEALNQEIAVFQRENDEIKIIPYVVGGIPNAKEPEDECLPFLLRKTGEKELLAVNLLELGRKKAVLRILAAIYDLQFDQLVRRSFVQSVKRGLVIALSIGCFAVYIAQDSYFRSIRKEYYTDFFYQNEAPVGVNKISFWARKTVPDYYEFKMVGSQVLYIRKVGGVSNAEDPYHRAIDSPYIQFAYHTDGTLDSAVHMNQDGSILFAMNYIAGLSAVDFSKTPDGIEPYSLILNGEETTISRCILTLDESGFLERVLYQSNSKNEPVCDTNGVYGLQFQKDINSLSYHFEEILEAWDS